MSNLKTSNGSTLVLPAPVGYQLLDYIEATGVQNLDTGIVANLKEFILDIEFTNNTARELMGIGPSGSEYFGHNANAWENVGNSLNVPVLSRVYIHYDVGNITANRTKCWIDGSTTKTEGSSPNWDTFKQNNFRLFTLAGSGYQSHAKFYGLTVKNASGTITNQFYPAKRTSDNVIGLYDIITKTFKASTTSTAFTGAGTRSITLTY